MLAGLFAPIQLGNLWKEASVFGAPLILVMRVSGFYRRGPTWKWSNTIFHAGGNIGIVLQALSQTTQAYISNLEEGSLKARI